MGTCVTTIAAETTVDTVHRNNSSKLSSSSSDDEKYPDNMPDLGLRHPRKMTHSSAEVAYDTSTQTERLSFDERKTTESDQYSTKTPKTPLVQLTRTFCWTIGCNKHGAQGNGTKLNVLHLKKLTTLPHNICINNIIAGNCGSTYLICNNYTKLYVWGYNEYGSVSMENVLITKIINVWNKYEFIDRHIYKVVIAYIEDIASMEPPLKPFRILENKIKCLSLGITSFHKFLYLHNTDLYGIGKNGWGQLGMTHNEHRNINHCVKIGYFQKYGLEIRQIACALTYSIFLDTNGQLYSCGKAIDGGLGLGKGISWSDRIVPMHETKHKIMDIQCGEKHTLALSDTQQVLSWGHNHFGQCGHGHRKNIFEPKLIKYVSKYNLRIAKVSCGGNHNILLDSDGKIYCFGRNCSYECGNGFNERHCDEPSVNYTLRKRKVIDVKCGLEHSVVKTKDLQFYLWGVNDFNQCLVIDEDEHYVIMPTRFEGIDGLSIDYRIIHIYPGWKETRIVTTKVFRSSY